MVDFREVDPLRPIWPIRPGDQRNSNGKPPAKQNEAPKDDENPGDDDQDQAHVDTYA